MENPSTLDTSTPSDKASRNDIEPDFPEGGFGWIVVLGAFLLALSNFGYVNSWAMFQEYYEDVALVGVSSSKIAWIGSLQYSLIYFPGFISGRVFDMGYFKTIFYISTALLVIANFLIAECHRYWHFLLCQGILLGLSAGWLYVPAIGVISQWFKVKRSLAFSAIALAVSVGGIIYPIVFRNLIPRLGFKWTIRVIAFINLFCTIVAHLTLRTRLLPTPSKSRLLDLRGFMSKAYVIYTTSTFFSFLGLYTVLTFLSVSAEAIGISRSLSIYLVAIVNGASAIGRLGGGLCAFKIGAVNTMILFTTVAALMTYVWPFITNATGFIVMTVIYGASSGAFVALFPVPSAQFGELDDIGRRTGMQMSIMSLGALAGPPISGAIEKASGGFHAVGIYAGTAIVISVALMIVTRFVYLHRWVGGNL